MVYLQDVKKMSHNTQMSYQRDLNKMCKFLEERGIKKIADIKEESLNAFVLYLKENDFANATISRHIAALKGWFVFLLKEGLVQEDYAANLKAPKIKKKM